MNRKPPYLPIHRRRFWGLVLAAIALIGCQPSAFTSDHQVVLARQIEGRLTVLADDDALYRQFETEFAPSTYAGELLLLVDHLTEAYIATNAHTRRTQAVAGKSVVILDSAELGLLEDIDLWYNDKTTRADLALGLGLEGRVDLPYARQQLPGSIASLYLALIGMEPVGPPDRLDDAITSETQAFWQGFGAALEALQCHRLYEVQVDRSPSGTLDARRADRCARIPSNGYYRVTGSAEAGSVTQAEQAVATPGSVGTFFYRLLSEASAFYPQRYMLWFANFDTGETVFGKVFLAMSHMRPEEPSVQSFVDAYIEAFPADEPHISALAIQVFGEGYASLGHD